MKENLRWAAPDRYGILKDFARQNRLNQTDAELVLWQHIRERSFGTKFYRQYIIADYIVDFVSVKSMLIIEVDGAYHAELQQQVYDIGRSERLESLGFHVLRFSNEDVFNHLDAVLETIKNAIQ